MANNPKACKRFFWGGVRWLQHENDGASGNKDGSVDCLIASTGV